MNGKKVDNFTFMIADTMVYKREGLLVDGILGLAPWKNNFIELLST